MVLAVYKEKWKWYAQVGDQNLKKKNPQRRIIKKKKIINVRRGPTEYKS